MTKKILIDEAVVKQALYQLDGWAKGFGYNADEAVCDQLREALQANNKGVNALTEQPAAEPEGVVIEGYEDRIIRWRDGFMPSVGTKLYRYPPASTQQPLKREQLAECWWSVAHIERATNRQIAYGRAIEAAHGITSNQGD